MEDQPNARRSLPPMHWPAHVSVALDINFTSVDVLVRVLLKVLGNVSSDLLGLGGRLGLGLGGESVLHLGEPFT